MFECPSRKKSLLRAPEGSGSGEKGPEHGPICLEAYQIKIAGTEPYWRVRAESYKFSQIFCKRHGIEHESFEVEAAAYRKVMGYLDDAIAFVEKKRPDDSEESSINAGTSETSQHEQRLVVLNLIKVVNNPDKLTQALKQLLRLNCKSKAIEAIERRIRSGETETSDTDIDVPDFLAGEAPIRKIDDKRFQDFHQSINAFVKRERDQCSPNGEEWKLHHGVYLWWLGRSMAADGEFEGKEPGQDLIALYVGGTGNQLRERARRIRCWCLELWSREEIKFHQDYLDFATSYVSELGPRSVRRPVLEAVSKIEKRGATLSPAKLLQMYRVLALEKDKTVDEIFQLKWLLRSHFLQSLPDLKYPLN